MSEAKNIRFWRLNFQILAVVSMLLGIIAITNYVIDASGVIRLREYSDMAELSLAGNTIETPQNYNERLYQVAVIDEMEELPETIVIGCSRGMYLGEEITGYENLYNNCVSGACIEDYYALLGLYYQKFSDIPSRVILETSPWVFYKDNPESRWIESPEYKAAAEKLYYMINGSKIKYDLDTENRYLSIAYFQYNLASILHNGKGALNREGAVISYDTSERAEYSDGSIRYERKMEDPSDERLARVRGAQGALTYEDVDRMAELDEIKVSEYERIIEFMEKSGSEIILFMQPFSVTQCWYSYDKKLNVSFERVESYLRTLASKHRIILIGGYDSREYGISDECFIDEMHIDKNGIRIVWESDNQETLFIK